MRASAGGEGRKEQSEGKKWVYRALAIAVESRWNWGGGGEEPRGGEKERGERESWLCRYGGGREEESRRWF